MSSKRILIAGARGLLGRRVVRLCSKEMPDEVEILKASRDVHEGNDWRVMDIHSAELAEQLMDIDVLVNVVGPYNYDPTPIVAACKQSHCHYVDLCEVPRYLAQLRAAATPDGPAVIGGVSTMPGLVAVLCQSLPQTVTQVDVLLGIGSNNPVSNTLLFSLLRPLGRKNPGLGKRYFRQLVGHTPPSTSRRRYGRYPSPFDREPLQRGGLANRGDPLAVRFYFGTDFQLGTYLLFLTSFVVPMLSDRMLAIVCKVLHRAISIVGWLGTTRGTLSILGKNSHGETITSMEVSAESEGLDIPALPSVWMARALIDGEHNDCGVLAMESMMAAEEAAQGLLRAGFDVQYTQH